MDVSHEACVCVFVLFVVTFLPALSFPVLNRSEEALLSDRQDVSHPDQGADHPAAGRRRPGHARVQKGRTRD